MKPNILYLHGFQGFVTDEKKEFLDSIGNSFYPFLDYENEADSIINRLLKIIKEKNIDLIAGTSLGGMITYYLGLITEKPTMLLNPAVIAVPQLSEFIPEEIRSKKATKDILVFSGKKDEVVPFELQKEFFENLEKDSTIDIEFNEEENLVHLVELDYFKKFFKKFLKKNNY